MYYWFIFSCGGRVKNGGAVNFFFFIFSIPSFKPNPLVFDPSILEGIGYRCSSLLTKTEGHVSLIEDFFKQYDLILKFQPVIFLHHIVENHFLNGFKFSLNRPHWADSVVESPCPSVCVLVRGSAPSSAVFFEASNMPEPRKSRKLLQVKFLSLLLKEALKKY